MHVINEASYIECLCNAQTILHNYNIPVMVIPSFEDDNRHVQMQKADDVEVVENLHTDKISHEMSMYVHYANCESELCTVIV